MTNYFRHKIKMNIIFMEHESLLDKKKYQNAYIGLNLQIKEINIWFFWWPSLIYFYNKLWNFQWH